MGLRVWGLGCRDNGKENGGYYLGARGILGGPPTQ